MALGDVDYGLMAVVGGLSAFISFLNSLFGSAIGRFYGIAIGKSNAIGDGDIEECRRWFSIAVAIHTIIPVFLMAVGYPLGEWAVRHFLTIPTNRIAACIWVFRFVCISCFVGMVGIPFNAMYTMKQYIAELTLYSFVTATFNVICLGYMVSHPGVWLVKYAFWTCLLSVAPQLIIAARACRMFPECHFCWRYAWDITRFRQVVSYAGWTAFGGLAMVLKNQGSAILVNKFFGPAVNAAMGIAGSVNAHALSLTNALQGAMNPVITTAVGAGDLGLATRLAFRFCKIAVVLSLVFTLPLAIELPEIIRLWLHTPPEYVVGLCWIMLAISFVDKQTLGHGMIVMANGRVKAYQIVLGSFNILALPLAWFFCSNGLNVYWVGVALLITWMMLSYGRLYFARKIVGMSIRLWVTRILIPIIIVLMLSSVSGCVPRMFLAQSVMRVLITTLMTEIVLLPLAWGFVLDSDERHFIVSRLKKFYCHT